MRAGTSRAAGSTCLMRRSSSSTVRGAGQTAVAIAGASWGQGGLGGKADAVRQRVQVLLGSLEPAAWRVDAKDVDRRGALAFFALFAVEADQVAPGFPAPPQVEGPLVAVESIDG